MADALLGVLIGLIQGVLEWLPVSSEAAVSIALTALAYPAENATRFALVVHIGTAVAAVVYYRDVLRNLLRRVPAWRPASAFGSETADLSFYGLATAASGVTGIAGYLLLEELATALAGGAFVALIGVLLLGTGVVLWIGEERDPSPDATPMPGPSGADRRARRAEPTALDAVLVGLLQGLAVLPGVSRSGTTVSALLLRGYAGPTAIELSFVLSIPAALGAGAIAFADVGLASLAPSVAAIALVTSAVVGFATVDALTRLARRLAFSRICVGFGLLAIVGGGLTVF